MKVFCQENQILILKKRKDKDGEPVQNALVCVMMDSTIYQYGTTDSLGQITFTIVPQHTGVLHITYYCYWSQLFSL